MVIPVTEREVLIKYKKILDKHEKICDNFQGKG
jgi:hypothetical protein